VIEQAPPSMCAGSHAFDVEQLTVPEAVPDGEPKAEIHHITLNRRGDSIQVPAGYCQRATGMLCAALDFACVLGISNILGIGFYRNRCSTAHDEPNGYAWRARLLPPL
jgi:hypothetical protein